MNRPKLSTINKIAKAILAILHYQLMSREIKILILLQIIIALIIIMKLITI